MTLKHGLKINDHYVGGQLLIVLHLKWTNHNIINLIYMNRTVLNL